MLASAGQFWLFGWFKLAFMSATAGLLRITYTIAGLQVGAPIELVVSANGAKAHELRDTYTGTPVSNTVNIVATTDVEVRGTPGAEVEMSAAR